MPVNNAYLVCPTHKKCQRFNLKSRTPIPLMAPLLTIQWNLGCQSQKQKRINQSQHLIPDILMGWFFRFCFPHQQSIFHWIISNGVVNGIGRNGNVLIFQTGSVKLMTPTPTPNFTTSWALLLRLPLWLVKTNLKSKTESHPDWARSTAWHYMHRIVFLQEKNWVYRGGPSDHLG